MKKKYLYSLLTSYILAAGALSSCSKPQPAPTHVKKITKKVYIYKRPELKVRIDTLNITEENIKQITKNGAAGVFCPGTNTVVVYHFNPASDSSYIINYCEYCNNLRPLYMRHEMEHAKKQELTHNTDRFSPISRAEIAAINEIVAPAAEIIEAVDYHARTGKPFPNAKPFIAQADSVITHAMGTPMPGYINYNYQPVADAVITYATEGFLSAVNRGYYKYTIKKAYDSQPNNISKYTNPIFYFTFNPDDNKWDPIWEMESNFGKCNPYRNASWVAKQRLINRVDSVICSVTGTDQFTLFYKKSFFR